MTRDLESLAETCAAAVEVFGPLVYNENSRTRKALDRRVGHALSLWDVKYGPLNAAQEAYADAVLASCIRRGRRDAHGDLRKLYPFVQQAIASAIAHERVHAGFQRRAHLVDVSGLLQEALS